ncbi:MAG: SLBB domain-containing protein [Ignavibacteriaceae bacterium]|nr:SLBB domain-containing protein [Ignavibacteriaceae bacterium]
MMKKGLVLLLFLFACKISFSQDDNGKSARTNSMLNMYSISVTIGGDFITNGTFPASSTERVDQFVTRTYEAAISQINKSQAGQEGLINPSQFGGSQTRLENLSLRNILLKRSSGEIMNIDLVKFRVTGDFKYNPYLKNEDVLIFAPADFERNFFTVYGAVNHTGKFLYTEGDKLSDALILAQGVNKAYENVNKVEIDRLSYDGKKMDSVMVNINDDVPLQRGDRIIVLANEDEKKDFVVNVIGEVNRPGVIPISKDNETIKEVIDKCGGFKDDADLYKAELVRGANAFKSLTFSNQLEQLRMLRMSTLVEEDTNYFNIDDMLRLQRGNGLIDFNKLAEGDTSAGNFKVRDGDVIYIPQKVNLVYIFGQVNNPGYVKYVKGEKIDYYIAQAEGLGETASGDMYLIKGKSRAWYNLKDKEVNNPIEPGDYIWISKKTPRTFWYNVGKATQLASVITGFATILLIYLQLRKM